MIRVIVLILTYVAASANPVNYKFQLEQKLLKDTSILDYYLPTPETVIIRFKNLVRVVNIVQPLLCIEYSLPQSSVFLYGKQLSLIAGNQTALAFKSYQYPEKRILSHKSTINCVVWVNQTTALTAISLAANQVVGVYTASSDTIRYKYPSIYTKFKGIVSLLANDALLINNDIVSVLNLFTFQKYNVVNEYNSNFQPRCFKTSYNKDSPNNKIYEHIIFKQGRLLRKFTRGLQLSNGVIVDKTGFTLVNQFADTSYNCSFDFFDASQLITANQTASVVYRGIDVEDLFVGNRSSKLISNSIPVRGTPASFIKNGVLQTIQPKDLEIISKKMNMSVQNELKAWVTQDGRLVIFNKEQKVEIEKGIDGTSTNLTGILDCELIGLFLFLLRPLSATKIQLAAYNFSSNLVLSTLAIDNSTISQIKLEGVKIEGKPICMLSYQEVSANVVNQFWDFEPGAGLKRAIADTHTPYNKILIPTATTYYLVEDRGDIRTTISFYNLTDNTPKLSIRDVLNYKLLRVQETALVVYFGNERKESLVYTFKIDLLAGTVAIMNETFIQLDKMTDDIADSSVFFLPEIRADHQPNNNLIYFYSSSNSYFYNTLDPIFHTSNITRYGYNTLAQALLIDPQFNDQNLYYALPNFTFVRITYQPVPQPQKYLSCNFTDIFSKCRSVRMKIVNHASRTVISFLCNTDGNSIIHFYDASKIMACNVQDSINRLIYPLGVVDFDINSQDHVAVAHANSGNQYFDFYKGDPSKTLPIESRNIICQSDNGYFVGYLSNDLLVVADLITNQIEESQIKMQKNGKCSIDNSGTWLAIYNNGYSFSVFRQGVFYKEIQLGQVASKIELLGQSLLINVISDAYYYDSIFKNNAKYFVRDVHRLHVTAISHNQDYVAATYLSYDGWGNDNITVCRLSGSCFSTLQSPYYKFMQKVRSDGKLVIYENSSGSLEVWSNRLKECGDGSFISKGECASCSSDCASCEAETGACLDCVPQCSNTALIVVCVVGGVIIIGLTILAVRMKKQMRKHSSLLQENPDNLQ